MLIATEHGEIALLLWQCRDGRMLRLEEMETTHLRNAVAMMMLKPGWRAAFMEPMLKELKKRKQLRDCYDHEREDMPI